MFHFSAGLNITLWPIDVGELLGETLIPMAKLPTESGLETHVTVSLRNRQHARLRQLTHSGGPC